MLKRHRGTSPLPPSSSVPEDTSLEGIIDIRHLKRRRIAPPSLDGQTRGWNQSMNPSSAEEEYEEEEYVEEEVQNGSNEAESAQSSSGRIGEYAAMNSVLKEMHILQKHRQMFSEPVLPLPNTPQVYPSRPELDKTRLSYHPEQTEELARVYEHYEEPNKFLAFAFLERRKRYAGQP